MTECNECKRSYEYDRNKGHTKAVCNSCMSNRKRHDLKDRCVEYKGGKCERCGYCKSKRALAFHHLDPSQKDFGISGSHSRNWGLIKKELDKCIMVCHNCHSELHDEIESGPVA